MALEKQDSPNLEFVGLRLSQETINEAKKIAKADERSFSYVLRKAIERCLPTMKKELDIA